MAMGELMRKAFRASDVVGRIEPLRFAVLLPDCTDEALAAVDGVRMLTDGTSSSRRSRRAWCGTSPAARFDDLMFAAATRTKQIRREQQVADSSTTQPSQPRNTNEPRTASPSRARSVAMTTRPSMPETVASPSAKRTTTACPVPRCQAQTPAGAGIARVRALREVGKATANGDDVAHEDEK